MRLLLVIFLTLGILTVAQADDRPRCEVCRMFWDISSTRVEASIKADGKTAAHKFESFGCLAQFMKAGDKSLVSVKVLDYGTAASKTPKLIDAKKAWFLHGTSKLKGSMAPFIAAFATKDAATKAQKDLGGDLMQWDKLWKKLTAAK